MFLFELWQTKGKKVTKSQFWENSTGCQLLIVIAFSTRCCLQCIDLFGDLLPSTCWNSFLHMCWLVVSDQWQSTFSSFPIQKTPQLSSMEEKCSGQCTCYVEQSAWQHHEPWDTTDFSIKSEDALFSPSEAVKECLFRKSSPVTFVANQLLQHGPCITSVWAALQFCNKLFCAGKDAEKIEENKKTHRSTAPWRCPLSGSLAAAGYKRSSQRCTPDAGSGCPGPLPPALVRHEAGPPSVSDLHSAPHWNTICVSLNAFSVLPFTPLPPFWTTPAFQQ